MTAPSPSEVCDALRTDLEEALRSLYQGPSTFLRVFEETPVQALAAIKERPGAFGPLRAYLGRTSLESRRKTVVRLAKLLLKYSCQNPSPRP